MEFSAKEVVVLVIATALAFAFFKGDDPLIFFPGIGLSWAAFIYICVSHQGSVYARIATAMIISCAFVLLSFRTYTPTEKITRENGKVDGLQGSILFLGGGGFGDQTMVFVVLELTNGGRPTIATDFAATIKSEDNLIFYAKASYMPEQNAFHNARGETLSWKQSDMLYEKTKDPIRKGGQERGFLVYLFDGISSDELRKRGFSISIKFEDAYGKHYEASGSTKDLQPGRYYIPGIEMSFLDKLRDDQFSTPLSPTPGKEASPH